MVNPPYPIGPGSPASKGNRTARTGRRLQAVSCASQSLCVAVSYEGFIYVSTDPTGGADAWSPTVVNEDGGHGATHLIAVSCPSPSFCAAVSGGSTAPTAARSSPRPTRPRGNGRSTQLGGSLDLRGISCGTPVALRRRRPGRPDLRLDQPHRRRLGLDGSGDPGRAGDLEGVDCVSTLLCAAGNLTGNILTSTDPAGGGATWSEANAGGSVQITGVSCPTAIRCVAVDNNGDVLTSTDPTGGRAPGTSRTSFPSDPPSTEGQPPRNALFGASCASTSLCALVGVDGRIFTATDPFSAPADPPAATARRAPRRPARSSSSPSNFWEVSRHPPPPRSAPAFASTRRPGPRGSNASATAVATAAAARRCATGRRTGVTFCGCAPSARPDCAAGRRSSVSACAASHRT